MATITAPSMRDRVYVGAHGNLSVEIGKAVLTAAAVDDVVELLEFPVGMKFVGVRVVSDGLGAGVKVDIKAGDSVLAADVDISAACAVVKACAPVYTEEKRVLTATIKGGVATGELVVMPEYLAVGY